MNGILPPMATPFTAGGADIDYDAVRFNVDRWTGTGLCGLVVLGTNGEAPYVTPDEAERLVATVRERWPADRALVAGAGHDATQATMAACRRAAAAGADAVLVRLPSAFKGQMTSAALVRHFTAVADTSPAPVILYNFAASFGVNLGIDALVTLAAHPNIVGLKESGGDVTQIAEQIAATPDDFLVVVGSAPSLFASLCVGANGGVVAAANVVPDLCVRLYDLTRAGRHADALGVQRAITRLAKLVTATHGVPGLKAAMTLAGYRGGEPRLPLAVAPEAVVDDIRRELDRLAAFEGDRHATTA